MYMYTLMTPRFVDMLALHNYHLKVVFIPLTTSNCVVTIFVQWLIEEILYQRTLYDAINEDHYNDDEDD